MTAVKTGVSTKTKVVVGVGLLAIAGLAAYGFTLFTSTSTSTSVTITPAPTYKPMFIIATAADAPSNAKTIYGVGVIAGKVAVSSEDAIKWGKLALISMTVRRSGTATASAFKNWKLCSPTSSTCVSGAVSGSDITFSNIGSLLSKNSNSSLIKAASAQDIVEKTLVVKVDIASGYKGTLALSLPSTSSVYGLKTTEWVPSSGYLQKAGIIGPSEIVGPSDIVYGETSPQVGFSGGASSLIIGSVYIQ